MDETLILLGGAFNLALALFHVFFWRLFRWKSELARLTALNRAVMQVMNLCLMAVFLLFAYVSFEHTAEMLQTPLGRSLTLLIAIFWFLRALEQPVFFGLRKPLSVVFFVVFCLGGALYALPLLQAT
jgi:hypothetical protein